MAADQPPPRAPRFATLTYEQFNAYQKPLGKQILKVSSVGLGGPYNPLLRSPVLGQRMFDLLYYLRWNSSVPPARPVPGTAASWSAPVHPARKGTAGCQNTPYNDLRSSHLVRYHGVFG